MVYLIKKIAKVIKIFKKSPRLALFDYCVQHDVRRKEKSHLIISKTSDG